jgi:hypothetical protein
MDPDIITELAADLATATASTSSQRQLLYKLGRSRSFVKNYASTRIAAGVAINTALAERAAIERRKQELHLRKMSARPLY